MSPLYSFFFFFNDTATTEIYTLSLHDALPISRESPATVCVEVSNRGRAGGSARTGKRRAIGRRNPRQLQTRRHVSPSRDRKSTRLNSSHSQISYAVFCLKKKKSTVETYYPHCV